MRWYTFLPALSVLAWGFARLVPADVIAAMIGAVSVGGVFGTVWAFVWVVYTEPRAMHAIVLDATLEGKYDVDL